MKNYQYVLDIETPFIKKLYDKEDDYKVEFLTPYGILKELKKLQEENSNLEAKLAEKESELIRLKKNWNISRVQQRRLYNKLKQESQQKIQNICNMIEAQMTTEVFCDGEFTSKQFINAINKIRNGGPFPREWSGK